MRIVWSAEQLKHRSTMFVQAGKLVASPETPERATIILEAALARGHETVTPRDFGLSALLASHDEDYVAFLATAAENWSAFAGSEAIVMPNVHPRGPHARHPDGPVGLLGWHTGDMACQIAEGTWQAAYDSAQTAATAAVLTIEQNQNVYALCRPPGHHASRDRAMGFCYLNNAAIAAEALRKTCARVAVLDVDVHHGNGTQDIFYDRGDVFFASIHGDPGHYYPFYWGYSDQTGAGPGEGATLNVPFPVGSGDGPFLHALDHALAGLARYAPDALVLSLGTDASVHDPHGRHSVTDEAFRRMADRIAGLKLPTVIVQEGGYASAHLGELVTNILEILD